MTSIPTSILLLLVGYFSQTLTEQQHDELDKWMCADDGNQRIFEECLEITLLPKIFQIDGQEFEFEITRAVNLN